MNKLSKLLNNQTITCSVAGLSIFTAGVLGSGVVSTVLMVAAGALVLTHLLRK